jgi:ribonucleoside-diphosphate reductase alpha chain
MQLAGVFSDHFSLSQWRVGRDFYQNSKVGSDSDSAAKDSAVVCSIALQHGVPLSTIRKALLRDPRGVASSPLGMALDLIAAWGDEC